MTEPDITLAATTLCDVLAQENAALTAMDFPRAISFVAAKQRATEQLLTAQRQAKLAATPANRALAAQLTELSTTNKTLLERAMIAQNRVLACIARALPKAEAHQRQYGARGTQQAQRSSPPVALFSRA